MQDVLITGTIDFCTANTCFFHNKGITVAWCYSCVRYREISSEPLPCVGGLCGRSMLGTQLPSTLTSQKQLHGAVTTCSGAKLQADSQRDDFQASNIAFLPHPCK